jgi:hypothetical protein
LLKDGGVSSSKLASSLVLVTPNLGTPSAGVLTNCTGTAAGLTAGAVTINANLTGDVTSVGNATSIASGVIVNADINASAAIVDTKLDTIATALKVSNSATTAASANTASAIVARDASGNFSAGTITATLTGTASAALASGLTGSTLASGVTASSLTSLGTITSINVTGGSIVGITDLAIADGGTGASTKAGALTALGLLQSNLNSNLSTASAVTQSGTLGADKVFDTPNAPTVSLTAGTWLVTGSVGCRTSDNSDNVWAQFYNNTDAAAFGGGCSIDSNVTDGLYRRSLSVSGIITVASGTKVIYFKCFRAGSSTLDIGAGVGPSGFIQAVQLYA